MNRAMPSAAGAHLSQATHRVPPGLAHFDGVNRAMRNVAGSHLSQATHRVPPASRTPLQ